MKSGVCCCNMRIQKIIWLLVAGIAICVIGGKGVGALKEEQSRREKIRESHAEAILSAINERIKPTGVTGTSGMIEWYKSKKWLPSGLPYEAFYYADGVWKKSSLNGAMPSEWTGMIGKGTPEQRLEITSRVREGTASLLEALKKERLIYATDRAENQFYANNHGTGLLMDGNTLYTEKDRIAIKAAAEDASEEFPLGEEKRGMNRDLLPGWKPDDQDGIRFSLDEASESSVMFEQALNLFPDGSTVRRTIEKGLTVSAAEMNKIREVLSPIEFSETAWESAIEISPKQENELTDLKNQLANTVLPSIEDSEKVNGRQQLHRKWAGLKGESFSMKGEWFDGDRYLVVISVNRGENIGVRVVAANGKTQPTESFLVCPRRAWGFTGENVRIWSAEGVTETGIFSDPWVMSETIITKEGVRIWFRGGKPGAVGWSKWETAAPFLKMVDAL